ncbi:alpha/beta hydrolase [Paenibacillus sp. MMS20-IR301]|uniref:alpha/beta fold hydrolase n=1 Tax=Paenibacillus sp. MMS20-IR301 TaxID=2895946 RepID=UPI0028F112DE|nr:alpha/beta hydrolase [Paenibacillus sp. MMS20-IR301]WNS45857.1 alpha/beta hydrolase [Paenibacillus sp. MMS20-IR301]
MKYHNENYNWKVTDSAACTPAVVFISGLGDGGDSWNGVHENISRFTSALVYDRPGTGRRPVMTEPRSCQNLVLELHELLTLLDVQPPYILVGHSFGGLVARLFVCCYPAAVAGLVLVDAVAEYKELTFTRVLPPQHAAACRESLLNPLLNSEHIDKLLSYKQVSAAKAAMPGDIPLSVITRGLPDEADADWPAQAILEIEQQSQAEFLEMSAVSRQVIAAGSGHYIQRAEPGIVIEEIMRILASRQSNLTAK